MAQVLSTAINGTDRHWLGEIGHVAGLKYSSAYPGGCDSMSCLLQVPPTFRTTALNPGRWVYVYRGAGIVWQGVLGEPEPSADGWTIQAAGNGTYGNQFVDVWTTWNSPDNHVNAAIARGMNWRNYGITGTANLWLGDQTDSGSQTITDFLNSITVQGALSWSISPVDGTLSIAPLPTAVTRLLVATTPVARTVAGDINSLFLYYQITGDTTTTAVAATYGLVNVTNAADIALHGTTEDYYDLSSNGDMTAAAVEANGSAVLQRYNRASFAGPFTVAYGQLLNPGGVPVDLGCETAGQVYRLILTDFGYGGEVSAAPITFTSGAVEYDDSTQTMQITPFQNVRNDFSSLLSAMFPTTATAD